jgi:hypothetical protein
MLRNATLGLGGLAGLAGLRSDTASDFNDQGSKDTPTSVAFAAGIGATTTAAVMLGVNYAMKRASTPALQGRYGALGMALVAGGAYATGRIFSRYNPAKMYEGDQRSALPGVLQGVMGLGALWYGGKAISPYLARSVANFDMQARPWFSAVGRAFDETQIDFKNLPNSVRDFKNAFTQNLQATREMYAHNQLEGPPLTKYLSLYSNIINSISDPAMRGTMLEGANQQLLKRHSLADLNVINGIRSATFSDLLHHSGLPVDSPVMGKARTVANLLYDKVMFDKLGLGKGVMFDTRSKKILNLNAYTPGSMLKSGLLGFEKNFTIPVAGFNPISILRPREISGYFSQGHQFHYFPAGSKLGPKATEVAGPMGAYFSAGRLYDVATRRDTGIKGSLVKAGRWVEGEVRHHQETRFGETMRMFHGEGLGKEASPGFINIGHTQVRAPDTLIKKALAFIEAGPQTGFPQVQSVPERFIDVVKNKKGISGVANAIKESMRMLLGETDEAAAYMSPYRKLGSSTNVFPTMAAGKGSSFAFLADKDIPGAAAFFLTNRPTRLLESLGVGGFDPRTTRTATDVIKKLVLYRFLPVYLAWKSLQFTNDMSNAALGIGPLEAGASLFAGANVGMAYMRDILGITGMAQYLEELMPGFITASGPSLARGIGLPILGGTKFGPKGLVAGMAASAALGFGGDITKTGTEKADEYFGDARVPLKQGRWWMFGSTPFEGGKVKEFIPNWYQRVMSRYQYTDVQYGSELKYWSQYLNPWYMSEYHYYDRPYPLATTGIEEIPFIGPALSSIAPTRSMHGDEFSTGGVLGTGIGPGSGLGLGGGPATAMLMPTISGPTAVYPQETVGGYIAGTPEEEGIAGGVNPMLGGLPPDAASLPNGLGGTAGEEIYRMTEYMGLYGFGIGAIKEQLTGSQDFFTGPQIQSARYMDSAERSYWEQNVGDPFGYTEMFRRFLPHRRRQIDQVNPIPNTMPDWMPGPEYFQNFRIGDPYSKVDFGEIRLPGSGYEKFYTPGAGVVEAARSLGTQNLGIANTYPEYSMLDIYRITGDVAPWSPQYRYAKAYLGSMSKAGLLTPEGEEERKKVAKEVPLRKRRWDFTERKFSEGDLQNELLTVSSYLGNGAFEAEGQRGIFKLAGIKSLTPEGEERLKSNLTPGSTILAQTLADERYRTKDLTVPTTPVIIGGLNRGLVTSGEAEFDKTGPGEVFAPMNLKVQYNPIERMVGGLWEDISHADVPYLQTKFMHKRTALEEWERTMVYGRDSSSWSRPIRDFVEPLIHKMMGGGIVGSALLGGGLGWFTGATRSAETEVGASTIGALAEAAGKAGKVSLAGNRTRILTAGVGAIIGGGLALAGGVLGLGGSNWVPEYRKKIWDTEQYFDTLEYLKYQGLYAKSRRESMQQTGMDPEELMQSIEASRRARKTIADQLKTEYGDLGLQRKKTESAKEIESIKKRRDLVAAQIERLSYQKWTEDAALDAVAGTPVGRALEYRKRATSTMYGADPRGDFASIMRALPNKQREFFQAFVQAPQEERSRILETTPLGMRRFLEAKWGMDVEANPDLTSYFQENYLPAENWVGWHPAVNLDDVKLKVARQEGLDIHDFNLWESSERELSRKPYVPLIDPFTASDDQGQMKSQIADIIGGQGYNNYDISVTPYASDREGINLNFDVKYATQPDAVEYIRKNLGNLMSPAYG